MPKRKQITISADDTPPGYKLVSDDGQTKRWVSEDGTAARLVTSDPALSARFNPPPSQECIERIEELERANCDAAWRLRFIRIG